MVFPVSQGQHGADQFSQTLINSIKEKIKEVFIVWKKIRLYLKL